MPKSKATHASGQVREAARDAIEAWFYWDEKGPEPTVLYEQREVPISRVLGRVRNCADIIPGDLFAQLSDASVFLSGSGVPTIRQQTYAACASFVIEAIKGR